MLVIVSHGGDAAALKHNVNTLLVLPDELATLANAIGRLSIILDMQRKFGAAWPQIVEYEYSTMYVRREAVALNDRQLSRLRRGNGQFQMKIEERSHGACNNLASHEI